MVLVRSSGTRKRNGAGLGEAVEGCSVRTAWTRWSAQLNTCSKYENCCEGGKRVIHASRGDSAIGTDSGCNSNGANTDAGGGDDVHGSAGVDCTNAKDGTDENDSASNVDFSNVTDRTNKVGCPNGVESAENVDGADVEWHKQHDRRAHSTHRKRHKQRRQLKRRKWYGQCK